MAKKILIADDDLALVDLVATGLKEQGFDVITASNGTEALAKALREIPDLILLDVVMPGLAGYRVFEKLQADPHTKNIPVIVLSVRKSMEDLFPQTRLITFVSKPFDINVLFGLIGQSLTLQNLGENKNVLILGVQEFVVNKIKEWFEKKGYKVTTPLNEYDAIQKCEKLAPKFFFCQFWGDSTILDSATVYEKVKYGSVADKVNFYIYCPQGFLAEAKNIFPLSMIVPYVDSRDLLIEVAKNIVR